MSSHHTQAKPPSRPPPRHPAEMPFFVVMVILNVAIIAAIIDAAGFLPFRPESLKQSGWVVTIRTALIALLLFIPALIVVRETQRAGIRGTAVQLSERQYPELYETVETFAQTIRLRRRPDIFLANGNGTLNAFAAQATGHDYVVLANELFANLYDNSCKRPAVHPRPRAGPHPVPPRRAFVPDRHRLLAADPAARPHALPATGVLLRPEGCRPDTTRGDRSRAVSVRPVHRERYRYRRTRPARMELRGFWLGITQVPRSHLFTVRRLKRLYGLGLFGSVVANAVSPASSAPRARRPGNASLR